MATYRSARLFGAARRTAGSLLPFVAALAVARAPAAAQRSLTIRSFDAAIEVGDHGAIEVREAITARFVGSWNGLYRTIPVEYRTPQGFSYRLFLDVESVTDESGRPLRTEISRDRHYRKIKVWVPNARDVTRTIHVRYTVPNGLKFFEEHDELYWNVTGDEWDVPIEQATAVVDLPAGVTGLRATAFTGGYGSVERAARMEETDRGFFFETTRGLSFREGLTIGVAWNPGVVHRPGPITKAGWFLRANWLLLFPFLSLGLVYRMWSARGRDPAARPVMPEYEPPEGLAPAEAGTLLDNRPDLRDLTATVVDLAVRGHLRIEETELAGFLGLGPDKDYRFVRLTEPSSWLELHAHERKILDAFFGPGQDSLSLSDLEHEFYTEIPDIRTAIFNRLVSLGHYARRPDKVLAAWMIGGAVVLAAGLGLGLLIASRQFLSPLTAILAAAFSAAPVFGFGLFMPARTVRGARTREALLGFQEFMERVEEDRFRRMITSPEMFEHYLPFAMALGVEKKWAAAFDGLFEEPPRWYLGPDPMGFRPSLFVTNLSNMATRAGAVMVSQPRSSGGSAFGGGGGGFSGGGFSGGGFGGGGGGGF